MKSWDLTSGASKLDMAIQSLRMASVEAEQYWSDEAQHKFHESYILPLEPTVRNVLDSIHRLEEVMINAERHCGMNSNLF
jgi:hypothetical protein